MDFYKVEIRKERWSKSFNRSRYPDFRYVRTGRYAYHWEAVVPASELPGIRRLAKEDRFKVKAVPTAYVRSGDYRRRFLQADPGPYRCRYCDRKLTADDVTVDHLVSVSFAQRSPLARKVLMSMGAENVNDLPNLVPACSRCNGRKAGKGGLWVVRGMLGAHRIYWTVLKILSAAAFCLLAAWAVAGLRQMGII